MEILRNQEFSDKTEKFTKSSTTSIRHFSIFFYKCYQKPLFNCLWFIFNATINTAIY